MAAPSQFSGRPPRRAPRTPPSCPRSLPDNPELLPLPSVLPLPEYHIAGTLQYVPLSDGLLEQQACKVRPHTSAGGLLFLDR